jgi:hypothetical protein
MKPYIPIKVYRWFNKNDYKIYLFDKLNNDETGLDKNTILIKEFIYFDDNLNDALNKIVVYINNHENTNNKLSYFWYKSEMISHNIKEIKWNGFNINPFLSSDLNSKDLNEDIIYYYNDNKLFDYKKINIVFSEDIQDNLKTNKYYFVKKTLPTYKIIKARDELLFNLVKQQTDYLNKYNDKFNRVDLSYNLKKKIILPNLFDKMKTKKNIALIQWVNDNSKILYKLQKKHLIKLSQLNNWCSIDKINKINCINIYYIITNGCYCKITISADGLVTYSYILDIRKNITWNIITKETKYLTNYLEGYVSEKITMMETQIKLNTSYLIDNVNLTNILSVISKYIDIFNVKLSKNKQQILCIYKRSQNYNNNISISEYIINRYNIGISTDEIINELITLGFERTLASNEVTNIIDNQLNVEADKTKEYNIKDNGTILLISKHKQLINVEINNVANFKELNYLYYWLFKIISQSRTISKNDKIAKVKKEVKKEEIKNDIDDYDIDNNILKDDDDKLGEIDYDLDDDDDDLLLGGALGKVNHSLFVELMKQYDKDLVGDNYARDKCQAGFQPIVLNKKEKELLEKNKQNYYDNIIEYGSSKQNLNFYACPKVWCPTSKIPLNPSLDKYECPLENEEPILMFWGKDKVKKRYVKLIKPNEKGICAPCCGKKQQKSDELSKCKIFDTNAQIDENTSYTNDVDISTLNDDKKDLVDKNYYLMNQKAPIEQNRFGSINEKMHEILLDEVSYETCSKMLNKTQKCFIRKGIKHRTSNKNIFVKNDSIIHAISNVLNFSSKNQFINDIEKKLDLITYISLENGNICKDFHEISLEINTDKKKIIDKINKKKALINLFNYDSDNKNTINRLILIYNSYNKFINYLKSDDYPIDKLPYYLYTLVAILYNKLLIIWEYNENDINILCPLYTSYHDIMTNLDMNPEIIMLLKDRNYYEPIELRNKSTKQDILYLNDYKYIKNIINECTNITNNKVLTSNYNNVYSLNQWIKSIGDKYYIFEIDTVLINNDLTISYVITKSNILLYFDKISVSLLSKFIKDMNIKTIKFYDDIINKVLSINNINKYIYRQFTNKCDELDIKYIIGTISDTAKSSDSFSSKLKIPELKLKNNSIINISNNDNRIVNYIEKENKISYEWFKLQKLVAKILIKNYNDNSFNKKYKNETRNNLIDILYTEYFTRYNNKQKIKIILEELPLQSAFPITNIEKWLSNIIIFYKYDFMSYLIKENKYNKDELVFSQNVFYLNYAFEIPKLLINYHDYMPNKFGEILENTNNFILNDIKRENVSLPSIYKGSKELLPGKWRSRIKAKWVNLIIIKSEYSISKIEEFVLWLSNYLNIKITYRDIKDIVEKNIKKLIFDKKNNYILFDDPSFTNLWNKNTNINKSDIDKHTNNSINKIIDIIVKSENLYPNDITFKIISDVFNISILLIHRVQYGTSNTGVKRNEIEDLKLSSTFISATKNINERPLLIFNKVFEKDKRYVYYPIVENDKEISIKSLYLKLENVQDSIKMLIDLHLNK